MVMTEESQFDGLLGGIIERCGGIQAFIDVVFSFLARRTDFFTPDMGNSNLAHDTVLKALERYKKIAQQQHSERKKVEEEQVARKRNNQNNDKCTTRKADIKLHPRVEEVENEVPCTPIEQKSEPIAQKSVSIAQKSEPIANGGITEKYTWSQTLPIVDVYISVPKGTLARQCNVSIGHDSLRVEINKIIYIDGKLHDKVKQSDCMWTLEDQKILHIVLEKYDGMKWWNCVIQGDPEIDTQKIIPENSKLSDLDPELRQTVEKMMFDQEQKAKGLPSSDQLKQAELLEKFKQAHPEMDFSKAKICNSNSFGDGSFQF